MSTSNRTYKRDAQRRYKALGMKASKHPSLAVALTNWGIAGVKLMGAFRALMRAQRPFTDEELIQIYAACQAWAVREQPLPELADVLLGKAMDNALENAAGMTTAEILATLGG